MNKVIGYVVLSGKIAQTFVTTRKKATELAACWNDLKPEPGDARYTIAEVRELEEDGRA